jgi:hypothetical protein
MARSFKDAMDELAWLQESAREIALGRFRIIQPCLEEDGSLSAIFRQTRISYRTIHRWLTRGPGCNRERVRRLPRSAQVCRWDFSSSPPAVADMVLRSFDNKISIFELCRVNYTAGAAYAQAALELMEKARLKPQDLEVIGFDG